MWFYQTFMNNFIARKLIYRIKSPAYQVPNHPQKSHNFSQQKLVGWVWRRIGVFEQGQRNQLMTFSRSSHMRMLLPLTTTLQRILRSLPMSSKAFSRATFMKTSTPITMPSISRPPLSFSRSFLATYLLRSGEQPCLGRGRFTADAGGILQQITNQLQVDTPHAFHSPANTQISRESTGYVGSEQQKNSFGMHSNNLDLKNTLFFKLEIQEKIVEMVGMLPLEEPLPINGSLIEEMLREEGHDDPDDDEYEDEVKYFVVETDRLVKKSVEKTICKELGSVFGCEIAVKSEAWRGEQRLQTLFLSIETNKQAATITTYKFLVETSNLAITLYPTTKPLKDLLPQSSFQVAQILLEIATKYEYSGLKIVSILCSNNVLTVCLQLGETTIHGRLSIPQISIPNKKKQIFNPRQLQCQLKVKIMKSIIQNLLRQPQDIQIECNSQADHSESKEREISYECYQLLTFKKEVMLTHELHQTYGIVCQWMRKNRYNTFLFSTAKEKLYIRKIVELVTQALQTQSPETQQLRPYLTKIAKQHNPKQIITTFTSLFHLIATDYRSELQNPCSSRL